MRLKLWGDIAMPAGGIVVQPPLPRPIQQVTVNHTAFKELSDDRFTLRQCPAEVVIRF
jgi:hypothetical protein